jgi:hypothetical protein
MADLDEDVVAGRSAQGLVDGAEVVQIHEQHAGHAHARDE